MRTPWQNRFCLGALCLSFLAVAIGVLAEDTMKSPSTSAQNCLPHSCPLSGKKTPWNLNLDNTTVTLGGCHSKSSTFKAQISCDTLSIECSETMQDLVRKEVFVGRGIWLLDDWCRDSIACRWFTSVTHIVINGRTGDTAYIEYPELNRGEKHYLHERIAWSMQRDTLRFGFTSFMPDQEGLSDQLLIFTKR